MAQPQALLHRGDGESAGRRKAVVAVPTIMDRNLNLWCPRTPHRGLQHEAGLIHENNGTAFTLGFFSAGATRRWASARWPLHAAHGHGG